MRQCELKKRYDPDLDAYVTKHIYGEGISDVLESIGRKIFGKTVNKVAKTAAKKAATTTGEYAGNKAGDKIVELLSKNKTTTPSFPMEPNISPSPSESNVLTDQEINDRVNRILSGGKLRRRNFI